MMLAGQTKTKQWLTGIDMVCMQNDVKEVIANYKKGKIIVERI